MRYRILGRYYDGVPWEDYLNEDNGPSVTITADPGRVPEGEGYAVMPPAADGWVDVCVPILTRDVVLGVLAAINGLLPSQIQIFELNAVLSL